MMDLHPSEHVIFSGHPSWRSTLAFYLKGIAVAAVIAVIVALATSVGIGVAVGVALVLLTLVAGLVRRTGTQYVVTNERLRIRRGILSRSVQETRLDRVQNVNIEQTPLERLLRVGTVDFDTAGTDDSDFAFRGVDDPDSVAQAVDSAQRELPRA
jgi:uncharacterized membrane protein YdbT with pleckstrin-like domain